jgi:hypothetical protein
VNQDIRDFVLVRNKFDSVLLLGILHHFIKTERGHQEMQLWLNRLVVHEAFLWTQNVAEIQMKRAYRNYSPLEFTQLVKKLLHLRYAVDLGTYNGRQLIRMYHRATSQ